MSLLKCEIEPKFCHNSEQHVTTTVHIVCVCVCVCVCVHSVLLELMGTWEQFVPVCTKKNAE